MSFLDKLKDTVSIADVSHKISDTTTALKLKNQIRNNEKEIDRLACQAGRQLVSRHLDDENSEYKEIFQEIKKLQSENLSILNELDRIEKEKEQERLQRMKEEQEKLQRMKEEQERLQRAQEAQERLQQIKEEQEKLQQQKRTMQETLKTCAKCGRENTISAKFCVYCGNPLTESSDDGENQMQTEET